MPSPFPGMDPFIEAQDWEDFHITFMTVLREILLPTVRPRYEVKVERRVYVTRTGDAQQRIVIPDVSVFRREFEPQSTVRPAADENGGGTATAIRPVKCRLPAREEKRETFLTIRRTGAGEIVTAVEMLSPDNKRKGAKGRRLYLRKRNLVLDSSASLVELDLLRGGTRLPMRDPLPPGHYYALVSRGRLPEADVWAWTLPDSLPTIPIPLAAEDGEVSLDLEHVFTTVYDRAGYDYTLDYTAPLDPRPTEPEGAWITSIVNSRAADRARND